MSARPAETGASYGREEAAMQAYLAEGEERALSLDNRGPVRYTADGDSFRPERPVPWSGAQSLSLGANNAFDLHPDGERIALRLAEDEAITGPDSVIIVLNFFEELRRLTADGAAAP